MTGQSPAVVIVGGEHHGDVIPYSPTYATALQVPSRLSELVDDLPIRRVTYFIQKIGTYPNIWRVATPKAMPDDSMTRQAMAALLGLTAEDRERCFVERIPDRIGPLG